MVLRSTLLAFALIQPVLAHAQETNYKEAYEQAVASGNLWKERAALLERENQALRDQLARIRPTAPPPSPAPGPNVRQTSNPNPATTVRPQPRVMQAEIPMNGAVNLESYGGPSISLNIWNHNVRGALVQVGNEARRNVEFNPDGRVLLHRDASGRYEVYLLNSLTRPNTVKVEFVYSES